MRDTLRPCPFNVESGIVNVNTSNQAGSHWVCYYRNKTDRIYFDSYAQITPVELQRYLKKLYREIQILYKLWSSLLFRIEIINEW